MVCRVLFTAEISDGTREKRGVTLLDPPHATILAVGAAEQRVIMKDGVPAAATLMSVTLSCDHRAVDGVVGANLLAAFKDLIEQPAGMLV